MRLICPNCDAQYEVDASLIPAEGRDVQCSACGHVWFQSPEMTEAELVEAEPEEAPAPEPEDPQVLRRHSLDESMLAVLREEAERETRARSEEAARAAARSLEIQPELGLPEAPAAPRLRIRPRAQAPAEEPPQTEEETPEPPAPSRAARRELLPDIEAINSTLDANGATGRNASAGAIAAAPDAGRSGFRLGFGLVILLAVLAWLLYAQAPRLIAAAPQAEPALRAYVATIDKGRVALDGLMQQALNALGN
ncbi:MAG: zinc-ribbon domain-containing protein [Rhodobacterales bacterium]|nr:zinc-ribbon domain-containing protein [Rhodobacterales bacterium]MDX5501169.1 zinc-ribbon domain-containing protein [Rhodobacterales bacterium]